jgi:hypothetical protein
MGDLLVVKERIALAVQTQLHQIKGQMQIERARVPTNIEREFFKNVSRRISKFALFKILKEYEKMFQPILDECSGYYRRVMGLPCCHEMQHMREPLSLENIHFHWHLDKPAILPLDVEAAFAEVKNPVIIQGRGRPVGALNRSVQRDPSAFERVENAASGHLCRCCGLRGTGHNAQSCPMNLCEKCGIKHPKNRDCASEK